MLATPSAMITVKPVRLLKAWPTVLVTVLPDMVTLVRPLQP
jgi:hypothetical protein